jgi:hypothetical protein
VKNKKFRNTCALRQIWEIVPYLSWLALRLHGSRSSLFYFSHFMWRNVKDMKKARTLLRMRSTCRRNVKIPNLEAKDLIDNFYLYDIQQFVLNDMFCTFRRRNYFCAFANVFFNNFTHLLEGISTLQFIFKKNSWTWNINLTRRQWEHSARKCLLFFRA